MLIMLMILHETGKFLYASRLDLAHHSHMFTHFPHTITEIELPLTGKYMNIIREFPCQF